MQKMKCCEYGPNKLECMVLEGLLNLVSCNTLDYWAQSKKYEEKEVL